VGEGVRNPGPVAARVGGAAAETREAHDPPRRLAVPLGDRFPADVARRGGKPLRATHHPFTAPVPEDAPYLDTDPKKVRASTMTFVLNGMELGGGSIRIHQPVLQKKVFEDVLKIPADVVESRFGYMLKAFNLGAPPHGGIAFGLDRIARCFAARTSIRDVIAFPKTQKARDLMAQSPDTRHRASV